MVLDTLFVGAFRWGIVGAAVVMGLSQCVGGIISLVYFLRPNDSLLRLTKTKIEVSPMLRACANGSSEMVSNVTASVVGMLHNIQLLKFAGEDGVSSYGVLMYVQFIIAAIFIGYSIGCAPLVSYHFGAENREELKNLRKKSVLLMSAFGIAAFGLAEALAYPLGKIFVGYDG